MLRRHADADNNMIVASADLELEEGATTRLTRRQIASTIFQSLDVRKRERHVRGRVTFNRTRRAEQHVELGEANGSLHRRKGTSVRNLECHIPKLNPYLSTECNCYLNY